MDFECERRALNLLKLNSRAMFDWTLNRSSGSSLRCRIILIIILVLVNNARS